MPHELRAATRSLVRNPTFTVLAVLTIGGGIGATTAVFSVVESIVLRPLPYPDADRLVDISHLTKEGRRLLTSWFDLVDLRLETEVFEDVAARSATVTELVLTTDDGAQVQTPGLWGTYNYLSVLGVGAEIGRLFAPEDAVAAAGSQDPEGPPPTQSVVIAHGLWQRMFGGDRDLSSQTIYLAGNPLQVIGVLPRDFQLLHERRYRWVGGSDVEIFFAMPETFLSSGRPEGRQGRSALQIGRLREGVTLERAQAAMDALAARYRAEIPYYAEGDLTLPVHRIREDLTEGTGSMILVLTGGVAFLMLLVCANVANLMLVRGNIHSGEDAVRAALGCGRLRLIAHKLWECAVVGLAGGALGLGLAWAVVRAVGALGPRNVPLLNQVQMNATTVLFAVAASMAAALVFGLLPALQVERIGLAEVLRNDSGRGGVRGRRRWMRGLVVAELALSTVLLCGALLMVRSMAALTRADIGFDPEGVLTFDLIPIDSGRRDPGSWEVVYRQLEERLAAIPGVVAVGRTSMPPLSGRVFNRNFGGTPEALELQADRADVTTVNPDYFRTMGTRLLAGRFFDDRDREGESNPIIVDESVARIAWPDQDPLGKRLYYGVEGTVVGVVESMLMRDYGAELVGRAAIHRPERRFGEAWTFVLRTTVDPGSVAPALRDAVRSVDPGLTPYDVEDLEARLAVARAPTRFVLFAMSSFAVVALIVAVGGLFGVISYAVRSRTAEFGLRMALGAERSVIRSMVLRESLALSSVGVLVGLGGTLLVSRALTSVVYEVLPTDPVMLGATALTLGATCVAACRGPAVWASRVDPVRALAS